MFNQPNQFTAFNPFVNAFANGVSPFNNFTCGWNPQFAPTQTPSWNPWNGPSAWFNTNPVNFFQPFTPWNNSTNVPTPFNTNNFSWTNGFTGFNPWTTNWTNQWNNTWGTAPTAWFNGFNNTYPNAWAPSFNTPFVPNFQNGFNPTGTWTGAFNPGNFPFSGQTTGNPVTIDGTDRTNARRGVNFARDAA